MTSLPALLYILSPVATVLAWLITHRRREHRPVAYLLALGLGADIARRKLRIAILDPARATGEPFAGLARIAAHLDDALFLAWPAALAATALLVFLRRRPWPILLLYIVTIASLALAYPTSRGPLLARAYLACQLAALAAGIGFAVMWSWRRKPPRIEHVSASLILGIELANLIGPWFADPFTSWNRAQIVYTVLYAFLIVVQGGSLWISSSSSRPH